MLVLNLTHKVTIEKKSAGKKKSKISFKRHPVPSDNTMDRNKQKCLIFNSSTHSNTLYLLDNT